MGRAAHGLTVPGLMVSVRSRVGGHVAAQGYTRDLQGLEDVLDLDRFQVVTSEEAVSRAAS